LENVALLDSKALTKIQSIILVAVIGVAAFGGGIGYVLLSEEEQSEETIKIGVLADLDGSSKEVWQSVILAAEQINAEGGLLGKQIEVIGEDDDGGVDPVVRSNALNRLITYHKVDFIVGYADLTVLETVAQHKKIFLSHGGIDVFSQQVLDDYDKYKYFFNVAWNTTSIFQGVTDGLLSMRENTGFTKIGYIGEENDWSNQIMDGLDSFLPQNGFELVYQGRFPAGTFDFASYFAAAEAAGVETMVPIILSDAGIPFVKEYYDRQSPIFLFGGVITVVSYEEGWAWTDGKCEDVCVGSQPAVAGYPLTSKTLATREAYNDRWDENVWDTSSYDAIRFILPDAIERAGTIETEAVIEALEETSIETTSARNFVFTPAHCAMMGKNPNDPDADYMMVLLFQWQDGKLVPVYPDKIMEEAGATYTFPDWPGPWD
jgi:branched-chain amino acid transport system substrate-binding protein